MLCVVTVPVLCSCDGSILCMCCGYFVYDVCIMLCEPIFCVYLLYLWKVGLAGHRWIREWYHLLYTPYRWSRPQHWTRDANTCCTHAGPNFHGCTIHHPVIVWVGICPHHEPHSSLPSPPGTKPQIRFWHSVVCFLGCFFILLALGTTLL